MALTVIQIVDFTSDGTRVRLSDGSFVTLPHGTQVPSIGAEYVAVQSYEELEIDALNRASDFPAPLIEPEPIPVPDPPPAEATEPAPEKALIGGACSTVLLEPGELGTSKPAPAKTPPVKW